jgi:hypothetical protein
MMNGEIRSQKDGSEWDGIKAGAGATVQMEMEKEHIPVGYQNCVTRYRPGLAEGQTLRIRLR